MNRPAIALLAMTSLAPLSSGQQSLSFTTLGSESTLSGSSGSSLGTITPEDVAIVTPQTSIYSAETYLDQLNLNTLSGDGNGDAFYYQAPLVAKIDALHVCAPGTSSHTPRNLYFSVRKDLPCASGGIIERGDVSRIRMGAGADSLIDDLQIRTALGITPNTPEFNVDAFTRDSSGSIYLSFEEDVPVFLGTVMLFDGGVAMIPAGALSYSGCSVASVAPNSGVVVFNEGDANVMCAISTIASNTGGFIQAIEDVDGLEIDPNGGTFTPPGTTLVVPNLIFSGEALTGGGILSTAGGGSIAIINGIPMGTLFGSGATDGTQVGLDPALVSSLNGLALSIPTCRFIVDSTTPYLPSPGPINFTAGGADPFQPVLFYARIFGVNSISGFQPSVLAANPCFPEYFLFNTFLFSVPADGLGIANVTAGYGGGVPVGNTVVLQAVTPKSGAWSLSAPLTYQF